ncbi:MAG: hypothetical protein APG11_01760 [Candidatus Methanofastidiosum methylothiophilum]|uniref:Uncharacterized protein n=1 Tax=Candidatus Methanofastidiosum methylothiophilum TaxID=1705564 RepID=A0A150INS6_9EURY|nr:MAG: hypothetical protein APG11_01760 [Candidatus Methanofastidiosum methylthiophilus]
MVLCDRCKERETDAGEVIDNRTTTIIQYIELSDGTKMPLFLSAKLGGYSNLHNMQ